MAEASEFLVKGKWTCTMCGACCKNVWPLVEKGVFPKQWMNKRGGCKNQMKSGKCRIYDRRPDYCRIDFTMPKASHDERAKACAVMKTHEDEK